MSSEIAKVQQTIEDTKDFLLNVQNELFEARDDLNRAAIKMQECEDSEHDICTCAEHLPVIVATRRRIDSLLGSHP